MKISEAKRKLSVLDEDIRRLESLLQDMQWDTTVEKSGKKAIALLEELGRKYAERRTIKSKVQKTYVKCSVNVAEFGTNETVKSGEAQEIKVALNEAHSMLEDNKNVLELYEHLAKSEDKRTENSAIAALNPDELEKSCRERIVYLEEWLALVDEQTDVLE
jgi:hypothetical protein